MNYSLDKLPAARLLYRWVDSTSPLNWPGELATIDDFLRHDPHLQEADALVSLYFPLPPVAAAAENPRSLWSEGFWIGRHVIGYENLEDHEEFSLQDLFPEVAYSFPVNEKDGELFSFTLCDLEQLFAEAGDFLRTRGIKMAPYWRLQIKSDARMIDQLGMQAHLNFFFQQEANSFQLSKKS